MNFNIKFSILSVFVLIQFAIIKTESLGPNAEPRDLIHQGDTLNEAEQRKRQEFENDDETEEEESSDYKNFMSSTKMKVDNKRKGPKMWDHWGKWSGCSVTCGVGRMTRWRHCVSGGCAAGEKEAQIRTCSLAAC